MPSAVLSKRFLWNLWITVSRHPDTRLRIWRRYPLTNLPVSLISPGRWLFWRLKGRLRKTGLSSQAGDRFFVSRGNQQRGRRCHRGKPDYDIGDRVKHVKYGEGTVTDLEPGPRDYKVTVDFDEAGQKIMYAAFAKLVKF